MLCGAQATSLTVNNKVAGTLSQRILYDDKLTIENLTVLGFLNADDFAFINELNNLTGTIDLSQATIVKGGRYYIGDKYRATQDNSLSVVICTTSKRINKLVLPKSIDCWSEDFESAQYPSPGSYPNLNCDSLIIDAPGLKSIGNGIGSPTYVYFGEGIETIQLSSKYLERPPGASDALYQKLGDSLEICLPSTIKRINGNIHSGSPFVIVHSSLLRPDKIATSGEWFETVFSKGIVYAPADSKEFYLNSIFKGLDIVAPVSVKSIALSPKQIQILVGERAVLDATILPTNADNKTIIWGTSNENIASVDSEGNISGLSRGECTVTATTVDGGHIAECQVTVVQPVESVSISHTELNIRTGERVQLSVSVLPTNANNKSIIWRSSHADVATIDSDGYIKGLSRGQCTITAITVDGGYTAECIVNVIQPVESINVTPKSLNLKAGESSQLSASVLPANANDKSVAWISEDENIVKVNQEGNVTAVTNGKTKIFAISNYDNSIKDYCEITVIQPVTGIVLNQTTAEISVDGSIQLVATVLPDNSTNKNVTWSSSDVSVAMVSGNGIVYGIKPGQATIMATTVDGGFSALCKAKVKEGFTPISEIVLNQTVIEGDIGDNYRLTASIFPENASNKTLVWQSDNEGVVSVDNNGSIRLLKSGIAMIKASATDGSGVYSECKVIVGKNSAIEDISVDNQEIVMIYSLQGLLLFKGQYNERPLLDNGLYILKTETGTTIKLIIKD